MRRGVQRARVASGSVVGPVMTGRYDDDAEAGRAFGAAEVRALAVMARPPSLGDPGRMHHLRCARKSALARASVPEHRRRRGRLGREADERDELEPGGYVPHATCIGSQGRVVECQCGASRCGGRNAANGSVTVSVVSRKRNTSAGRPPARPDGRRAPVGTSAPRRSRTRLRFVADTS